MEIILGIDIGTTNIKTMAISLAGGIVAGEHARTPVASDDFGFVHEPFRIVEAVLACLHRLLQQGSFKVLAVVVAGVGEEGIPLGEDLEPLYPAIVWYDDRTRGLFQTVCDEPGRDFFRRITGLVPGWEYTLFKLLWLREHGVGPVHRWLSLPEYVSWFLCGEMALSISQACRTMIFNLAARSLEEGILDRFSLHRDIFPPVRNGGEVLGPMRRDAAGQLGLDHLPLVVVGGHDHIVGAFALGLAEMAENELLDSKGTAEALMCSGDRFNPDLLPAFPSLGCGICADGEKYYTLASLRSGAELANAARLLGSRDVAGLNLEAERGRPGSGGLRYYPPGHGSAGTISGLADGQGPGDLARAFFEGCSFLLRYLVEQVEGFSRRTFAKVSLCGGGINVPLLLAIQAAVLNKPLRMANVPEAAALGACLLGSKALGLRDAGDTIRGTVGEERLIWPRPDWAEVYDRIYQRDYLPVFGDRGGDDGGKGEAGVEGCRLPGVKIRL